MWNEAGPQIPNDVSEDGIQTPDGSDDDVLTQDNQSMNHSKQTRGAKGRVRRTKTESVGTEELTTNLKVWFRDDDKRFLG